MRYEATGGTHTAVRDGIARTGRPITNAVAVLLDATIVRMLLVPTAIGLLGTKNWYLPRWLDRTLPNVRFSH